MRWILSAILASLLAGCGALQAPDYGGERIDTPTEIAGQAEAELTAAYATVTDLSARGVISLEAAVNTRDRLDDIAERLDQARALLEAGEGDAAATRLNSIDAALGVIQAELEARQ